MRIQKPFDIVIYSPWSGNKNDKRKLRHYNFIRAIENKYDKRLCLIVENTCLKYEINNLAGLNSQIIYIPAFDVANGSHKKIKRLASMILYPLIAIFILIFNKSVRNAAGYWVSSPHPGATIVGIVASFFRSNILYEIRDPWPELPIKTGLIKEGSVAAKIFKKIDVLAQKRSKVILLTSATLKKYLRSESLKKSIVVSNGLLEDQVQRYDHDFMKGGVLRLVFAGGCARAFRMDIIFKAISIALKDNSDLQIKFSLYIDPIEQIRFKKIVNKLGINNNISFNNKQSYNEMLSAIKKSDFYILHITDEEVFREDINSNKLLDAFACLKPVIFAANTKLDHIKLSGAGICSEPDSVKKLASSIVKASKLSKENYALMVIKMDEYLKQNLLIESKAKLIYQHISNG